MGKGRCGRREKGRKGELALLCKLKSKIKSMEKRSQVESYQSQDAEGLSNHAWIFTSHETHSNTIVVDAAVVLWTY